MEIQVLYEDGEVVVVNKPPGLVVNRAESVTGETMQDWMDRRLGEKPQGKQPESEVEMLFRKRSGMVHRLDKDTSGVMVWAKNPDSMVELMHQFQDRQTEKVYKALVHGKLEGEGSVRVPLSRSRRNRQRFEVSLGGRMSETSYKVLEVIEGGKGYQDGFSFVEMYPKTGRTHQLRVVLKHINHPIVGDSHYLGKKRARADFLWCPRQFLHACKLCFFQPKSKKKMCFEAELFGDLLEALKKISE